MYVLQRLKDVILTSFWCLHKLSCKSQFSALKCDIKTTDNTKCVLHCSKLRVGSRIDIIKSCCKSLYEFFHCSFKYQKIENSQIYSTFGHSIGKMCIIAFNGIPSPQSQRNRSSTLFSFLNALLIKQQFRQLFQQVHAFFSFKYNFISTLL